jgi:hypothetical protein
MKSDIVKDGDSVWLIGDDVFEPATIVEDYIYESPTADRALFVSTDERIGFRQRLSGISHVGLAVKHRLPSIANLPLCA